MTSPTRWRKNKDQVSLHQYGFSDSHGWAPTDHIAPVPQYEIKTDPYLEKHFQDRMVKRRLYTTGVLNEMGQFNTPREQALQVERLERERERGRAQRRAIAEMAQLAIEATTPGTRAAGVVHEVDPGPTEAEALVASAVGRSVSIHVTYDLLNAGEEVKELEAVWSNLRSLAAERRVALTLGCDSFLRHQWPEGQPPEDPAAVKAFFLVPGSAHASVYREELSFLLAKPCGYTNVFIYFRHVAGAIDLVKSPRRRQELRRQNRQRLRRLEDEEAGEGDRDDPYEDGDGEYLLAASGGAGVGRAAHPSATAPHLQPHPPAGGSASPRKPEFYTALAARPTISPFRALVEQLERAGHVVRLYTDPAEIARAIFVDARTVMDKRYPLPAPDLDSSRVSQAAFQVSRERPFVLHPPLFAHLDQLLAVQSSDKPTDPLAVTGPRGSGKSTLLATWARERRLQDGGWTLCYHVGATAESCLLSTVLREIIGSIKERFAVPEPLPVSPEDMVDQFSDWLLIALHRVQGLFVLVIDGLDEIVHDCAPDLAAWVPRRLLGSTLALHMRLIVSFSRHGPASDDTATGAAEFWESHRWPAVPLGRMDHRARLHLLRKILAPLAEEWGVTGEALLKGFDPKSNTLFDDLRFSSPGYITQFAHEVLRRDPTHAELPSVAEALMGMGADATELALARLRHAAQEADNNFMGGAREGGLAIVLSAVMASRQGVAVEALAQLANSDPDYVVRLASGLRPIVALVGPVVAIVDSASRATVAAFLAAGSEPGHPHPVSLEDTSLALLDIYVPEPRVPPSPLHLVDVVLMLSKMGRARALRDLLLNPDCLEHLFSMELLRPQLYGLLMQALDGSEASVVAALGAMAESPEAGMDEGAPTTRDPERIGTLLALICEVVRELFPDSVSSGFFDEVSLRRRAVDIAYVVFGSQSPRALPALAGLVAALLEAEESTAEADALLGTVLEISDALLARRKSFTKALSPEALLAPACRALTARASRFLQAGQWVKGVAYSERALRLMDMAVREGGATASVDPAVEPTIAVMVQCLIRLGAKAEEKAGVVLLRLRGLLSGHFGESHPRVATAMLELARHHRRTGRRDIAVSLGRKAYMIRAVCYGPDSPEAEEISAFLGGRISSTVSITVGDAADRASRTKAVRMPVYNANNTAKPRYLSHTEELERRMRQAGIIKDTEAEDNSLAEELKKEQAREKRAKALKARIEAEKKRRREEEAAAAAGGGGEPAEPKPHPHPEPGPAKPDPRDKAKERGISRDASVLAQDALQAAQAAQRAAAAQRKKEKEMEKRNAMAASARKRQQEAGQVQQQQQQQQQQVSSEAQPGSRASTSVVVIASSSPGGGGGPSRPESSSGRPGGLLAAQGRRGRRDSLHPSTMGRGTLSRPGSTRPGTSTSFDSGSAPATPRGGAGGEADPELSPPHPPPPQQQQQPQQQQPTQAQPQAQAQAAEKPERDIFARMEDTNQELKAKMALLLDSGKNYVHFAVEVDVFLKGDLNESLSTLWLTSPKPIQARVLDPGQRQIMHASLDTTLEPNEDPEMVDIRDDGNNSEVTLNLPAKKWDKMRFRLSMIRGLEVTVIGQWTRTRKRLAELVRIADIDEWGTGARFQIPAADEENVKGDKAFPGAFVSIFLYPGFRLTQSGASEDILKDVQAGVDFKAIVPRGVALSEDVYGWNRLVVQPRPDEQA